MAQRLLDYLAERWPEARVQVTHFPSGSVDIEIRLHGEVVVVQYSPRDGYGVSLLSQEPEAFTGFRSVFATVDEAIDYLFGLLSRLP